MSINLDLRSDATFSSLYQLKIAMMLISQTLILLVLLLTPVSPLLGAAAGDQDVENAMEVNTEPSPSMDVDLPTADSQENADPAGESQSTVDMVEDIVARLSNKSLTILSEFVEQIARAKRSGTSDSLLCFIQAAAATYPTMVAQSQTGHQSSSSQAASASQPAIPIGRLMEQEVAEKYHEFCDELVETYESVAEQYSLAVNQGEGHTTGETVPSIELCRLYHGGKVKSVDLMFAILANRTQQADKKQRISRLAAIARELFAVDEKNQSSGIRSLQLIEALYWNLQLEKGASFSLTLDELKQLRIAARLTPINRSADWLIEISNLLDRYGKSRQWRIVAYLQELRRRRFNNDRESLKKGVALLEHFQIGSKFELLEQAMEAMIFQPAMPECNDPIVSMIYKQELHELRQKHALELREARARGKDKAKLELAATIEEAQDYAVQCETDMMNAHEFAKKSLERVFKEIISMIPPKTIRQLEEIISLAPDLGDEEPRQPSKCETIMAVKSYSAKYSLPLSAEFFTSSNLIERLFHQATDVKRVQDSLTCVSNAILEANTIGQFSEASDSVTEIWMRISHMLNVLDILRPEDFGLPSAGAHLSPSSQVYSPAAGVSPRPSTPSSFAALIKPKPSSKSKDKGKSKASDVSGSDE